jgi:hypothetical protein
VAVASHTSWTEEAGSCLHSPQHSHSNSNSAVSPQTSSIGGHVPVPVVQGQVSVEETSIDVRQHAELDTVST